MSQKKLTPTIAKALAEQVREELKKNASAHAEKIKQDIKASKDYKQLCKYDQQMSEIRTKIDELRHAIQDKHSGMLADVSIYSYRSGEQSITIRETAMVSVEGIKNMILLDDYFSNSSDTPEELVQRVVQKIIKTK